jgi:MbtH protein
VPAPQIVTFEQSKGKTAMNEPSINAESDQYDVVVNDEEQYSIWTMGRTVPAGWRAIGVAGTRATCLAYIGRTWRDMRPRSLRMAMGEH